MFDSLDDQMKLDDSKVSTSRERVMKWLLVVLVSIVVFGGLYVGVHLLEGR